MSSPIKASDILANVPDPTSSKCSGFTKALLRIPVLLYQFFSWMLDADGNLSVAFKRANQPTGTYVFSAVELTITDDSMLACNGAAVSRETYAALFAVIGTVYGAGDTTTTFNLPDFRDRFPVGQSATRAGGTTGGDATHTLVTAEMPNLSIPDVYDWADTHPAVNELVSLAGAVDLAQVTGYPRVNTIGSSTPFALYPPWLSCWIYIRT